MSQSRRSFLYRGAAIAAATAATGALRAAPLDLTDDELQRRKDRSPEVVARQLAAVYGQQVKSLSYIPSMAVIGRLRLAQLTRDEEAKQHCLSLADDLAQQCLNREIKPGPEGAGLLLLAEAAPLVQGEVFDRNLDILKRVANTAFAEDGKPLRAMPGHNEMSDSVFMGCPLLAAVGKLTGERRYFDACDNHFEFIRSLCERGDKLYRHSPLCEAAWGRGNGFPALGLTMSLDYLPTDHPAWKKFHAAADALLVAVARHARPMVRQVVDHPDSYEEFSGTAMCAIAALRLARHSREERQKNERRILWVAAAWAELKRRISEKGELVGVCESTGKQKTLEDYFKRKAITGRDDRGGAFALLLATELMQAK